MNTPRAFFCLTNLLRSSSPLRSHRSPLLHFPLSLRSFPPPLLIRPRSPDAAAIPMNPTTSIATPRGSSAPAGPSSAKSGATKRQRKAAAVPLGDVTNLLPLLPDTPTPVKPRRSGRRPQPPPSDVSSTCSSTASVTPAPKPSSSIASVTPTPKPKPKPSSSSAVLQEQISVARSPAISTVYARRGATEAQGWRRNPATKGKTSAAAATGSASCPQLGRSTGNSKRKTLAQDTRLISSSAPCHEAKKKQTTPKLPEDFVKERRAYFADIDAFELPEEEVSESDLA